MIKAVKNGRTGIFSDIDWKSGQPQRYGWREEGQEGKTLPKAIVDFIERKAVKQKEVAKPEVTGIEKTIQDFAHKAIKDFEEQQAIGMLNTEISKAIPAKVSKPKTKKNDNPKQKNGRAGKRKPGSMAKA
jgi:predicted XRE-type DNA-binding protein